MRAWSTQGENPKPRPTELLSLELTTCICKCRIPRVLRWLLPPSDQKELYKKCLRGPIGIFILMVCVAATWARICLVANCAIEAGVHLTRIEDSDSGGLIVLVLRTNYACWASDQLNIHSCPTVPICEENYLPGQQLHTCNA